MRPLPVLIAIFAGAGSLAIELVWMRLLSLTFGSASLSAGLVVAAIMLGMALGSAGAPRVARPGRGLTITLLALAFAALIGAPILRWTGSLGAGGFVLAALFMTLASIPMGLVVPLLVAWIRPVDDSPRAAGTLYAANTLGAASAILLTGFVLLPSMGNTGTLLSAGGAMLLLAALPFVARKPSAPAPAPALAKMVSLTRREAGILALYVVSAFAAMVSEIAWMRGLVLSIGSSTYAWTLVLGVYVAGLGLGSAFGSRFLTGKDPAATFGVLQLLIAFACLFTLLMVGWMPDLFGRLLSERVSSLGTFAGTALAASTVALLPPTFLIGAGFPVTLGWLSRTVGAARASGWLLAAATGGSMVGAIAASFISIPLAGIETTLAAALLLHALGGSLVLSRMRKYWPSLATVAIFGMAFFRPAWDVRIVQSGPYIYGAPERKGDDRKLLFARDDHVASIAVFETPDGNRLLRIDGKTDASMSRLDLVTQLLTAHIPLALHEKPRRIALVGLGSGMTLASCLRYGPEQVDCIEISPAVVRASRFFDGRTGKPLDDPRVRLHVADARAAFRGFKEPFDVILNEPSNLWIAGMAGLFTEEFYKTCRDRLAEGGLMGQWIHAYGLPSEAFRDAVSTFLQVFPHATLWEMWVSGDYLLVGSTKPYVVDADALARRLAVPAIQEDLARIDADSVAAFLSDLVASTDDLLGLRQGARIQTDDGLHLEFSAPLGFYGRRRMPALNVLPPVNPESLERIVQGRPVTWSDSRTLLRRAVLSIEEKRPRAETIGLLQDALKRYPDERQARIVLEDQAEQCIREGNRDVAKGRVKEALEAFDLVPDESAAFAEARLRRVVLLKRERAAPEKIAEEYRRLLATLPDHASATSGLCEVLIGQGNAEEAERIAARAVQLNPKSALFRLTRGKALSALKRSAEAVVEWEEARKLDPSGPHGKEAERLLQQK